MSELYVEGVAIHDGPESCAVVREGDGEALTGYVQAGLLSREKSSSACRRCVPRRKAASAVARARATADPARSENLCMYGISMRENREIPPSPVALIAGRAAEGRPRPSA